MGALPKLRQNGPKRHPQCSTRPSSDVRRRRSRSNCARLLLAPFDCDPHIFFAPAKAFARAWDLSSLDSKKIRCPFSNLGRHKSSPDRHLLYGSRSGRGSREKVRMLFPKIIKQRTEITVCCVAALLDWIRPFLSIRPPSQLGGVFARIFTVACIFTHLL